MKLEDKEKKILWIDDIACPQEKNIVTKQVEKPTKYRQLAFELREGSANVIPVLVGALGEGIKNAIHEAKKIFKQDDLREKIVGEIQRTKVVDGDIIIWKILSRLVLVQTNFP